MNAEETIAPLTLLGQALSLIGVGSRVDELAAWPRLRVYGVFDTSSAEFDNSVVVIEHRRKMWFAWPWAERITRVGQVMQAAAIIADQVGKPGMS